MVILVVEDEVLIGVALAVVLRLAGHEVHGPARPAWRCSANLVDRLGLCDRAAHASIPGQPRGGLPGTHCNVKLVWHGLRESGGIAMLPQDARLRGRLFRAARV